MKMAMKYVSMIPVMKASTAYLSQVPIQIQPIWLAALFNMVIKILPRVNMGR
jgi:hypothetical protein